MANFFDKFPHTPYDINQDHYKTKNYDMPVNILVRIGVIKTALDGLFNYAEYTIQDGDTPEIIAEKIYGDPEAHWLVLLTNEIYDPHFDWPLNYDAFAKYIVNKYGSIATAQTQVHHYEKIIKSVDKTTGIETYNKTQICDKEYNGDSPYTVVLPTSPGTYYSKNINGYIVDIYDAYRNIVYCYDWEVEQNDQKRFIKLVKPDYYPSIKREFEIIMQNAAPTKKPRPKPGIRSLT